jgi:glycosyltransferase involved in cell wall biosynthesis
VLSVATFQPRKNLAHLIDAVRVVRAAALPDLQLVLVGPNGWGEADVRRDEAGVLFLGQVSAGELGSLYAHASMLAMVSRGEGFGLPVYEAFHAGVPVLASRGVPAAVESDAALLVSGADIDETANAIVRLITDEQLRDRLTARGSRVAASNTWQHVASRHLTVWDSLRVAG